MPSQLSKKNKTASVDSCNLKSDDLNAVYNQWCAPIDEADPREECMLLSCAVSRLPMDKSEAVPLKAPYLNVQTMEGGRTTWMSIADVHEFLNKEQVSISLMHIYIE